MTIIKDSGPMSAAIDEIVQEEDKRCLEELNRVAVGMPNVTIAEKCLQELYTIMMFREGLPSEGKAIQIIDKVLEEAAKICDERMWSDTLSDAEQIRAAKTKA